MLIFSPEVHAFVHALRSAVVPHRPRAAALRRRFRIIQCYSPNPRIMLGRKVFPGSGHPHTPDNFSPPLGTTPEEQVLANLL